MSMKNSNDIIGNRTRNLPACRAVPQPTASKRGYSVGLLVRNTICDPRMGCYVLPFTLQKMTEVHRRFHAKYP